MTEPGNASSVGRTNRRRARDVSSARDGRSRVSILDCTRAKTLLGYRPVVNYRDVLPEIAAFRRHRRSLVRGYPVSIA